MTNYDIAWLSGMAVTMIPTVIYFILLMTADYSPIERRARRLAILASVIVSATIWGGTATIYTLVSELVGIFLIYPSIGLTGIAVWHTSRITYRKMGGGSESNEIPPQEAGV